MAEWFMKQRVGDVPEQAAARFGQNIALWYGERKWTYRALADEIDAVARSLIALGIEPGDRIAIWSNNRPEWVFLMFAAARVGAVLVPLNTRLRTDDFAYTIRHSGSRMLFAADRSGPIDYLTMIDAAEISLDHCIMLSEDGFAGKHNWSSFMAAGADVPITAVRDRADAVDPDAPVIIAYTSGTTGHPKGVLHGHICLRNVVDAASRMGVTFQDVSINYLPLFHLYSYAGCCLMSVMTGGTQILMEMFDAELTFDLIERRHVSIIHGFDTHYRDLLATLARAPRALSSLRFGTFPAGLESSAVTAARVQDALCPTVSIYGMTELWCFASLSFANATAEQRSEASGYPMPGYDFRFIDPETGLDARPGCPGEILVRGYMVSRGYHNDPVATAAAIDTEGWLHTGDLGYRRPDGHLKFIGRAKDMLKTGGENVSPAEVEAFLARHPAIKHAAVVGVPDSRLAEVGFAFIVAGQDVSSDELDAFCRGRIASFKIPRHFYAIDALPMTPSGKVRKVDLKHMALAILAQSETQS